MSRLDFVEFHHRNPKVYDELVSLARDLRRRGYRKVGVKMLWEVVRWQRLRAETEIARTSAYRLNNNLTAYYAREIMANEPDLAGMFDVRDHPHRRAEA